MVSSSLKNNHCKWAQTQIYLFFNVKFQFPRSSDFWNKARGRITHGKAWHVIDLYAITDGAQLFPSTWLVTCFPQNLLFEFAPKVAWVQRVGVQTNRRTSPACQPLVPPFMSLRSAATSAKYLLDTNYRSPHPARPHRQDGRRSESFVQSVLQLWSTASRRARVGGHAAATCGVPAGLHDEIHVIPCNQGSFAANLF